MRLEGTKKQVFTALFFAGDLLGPGEPFLGVNRQRSRDLLANLLADMHREVLPR
jgi:hypothetical protein